MSASMAELDSAAAVLECMAALVRAAGGSLVAPEDRRRGDVDVVWHGQVIAGYRPPSLHGALDRLVRGVERTIGVPLAEMSREQKQYAVHLLDERGAFTLRHAIEDVAEHLGVSRFTIYNYLNARRPAGLPFS